MYIDHERCIGCGSCIPYCPVRAIARDDRTGQVAIDEDECVECEICLRAGVCEHNALTLQELTWPRILRSRFSNPLITHPDTGVPGRGTEEMKTNEVTARLKRGQAGMVIEVGRPGLGARFADVEKVAMAMASAGVRFEPNNPVTGLMTDTTTGRIREDVLDEKVLSAIIEFELPQEEIASVLAKLKEAAPEADTVFSLGLSCRLQRDGSNPVERLARQAGFVVSINGKTNVGLGRPLAGEDEYDAHAPPPGRPE